MPTKWELAWNRLRRTEVGLRAVLGLVAVTLLTVSIHGMLPPQPERPGNLAIDARYGLPAGTLHWHLLRGSESEAAESEEGLPPGRVAWFHAVEQFIAVWLLMAGLLGVVALYLFFRERRVLVKLHSLTSVLVLLVVTVTLAQWLAREVPYAELIPMIIFGQTLAVAYHRELALLFAGVMIVAVVLGTGMEVGAVLLWGAVVAWAILQLDSIRTRTKLLYVSMGAAVVGVAVRLLVALLNRVPVDAVLLAELGRLALACVVSGFLMEGLLPFVERFFGVLTDMSLLELSDLSHPLLRELARRAPSTYNHSINVGALAEAAAESIGARGLLVRVGAYFHDIGKMLKPGYFIENQADAPSKHETLEPTMSSLVIIAHVKDGADLARQHHLPELIIDFIEQHHGTTLVEYFYERARGKQESQPEAPKVDENNFRYPGPRPQTKEAAVLMLADAVESAVRSLKDPAPSRIEAVVRDIAEKKLHEGQFDDTNLTLRELRTIEDSLIKSLVAMYHGRIKYPERRTEDRKETERRSESVTAPHRQQATARANGNNSPKNSGGGDTSNAAVSPAGGQTGSPSENG
ncbi:HD family phosphohydrolase [Thermogutta terrifontis]|nr:HDIG domain-containing metalloprotein [Thermogutta terrifontis]